MSPRALLCVLLAAALPAHAQWATQTIADPMSDAKARLLTTRSRNAHQFAAPYQGRTFAHLAVRENTPDDADVIFQMQRGQVLCFPSCQIRVRFDDEAPLDWGAARGADGSPETIFLGGEWIFIERVAKAQRVRIEVLVFQEGLRMFEFNTRNFPAVPTSSQSPKN